MEIGTIITIVVLVFFFTVLFAVTIFLELISSKKKNKEIVQPNTSKVEKSY